MVGTVLKVTGLCMPPLVLGSGVRKKPHWIWDQELEDLGVTLEVILLLLGSEFPVSRLKAVS